MQKIFQLKNKPMPWGDYGSMLLSGMTGHESREKSGQLQLERTGPFVPPVFLSGINDIIVTDIFKQQLQLSLLKLGDITFTPVIKKKIVLLDWQIWDMAAEDPKIYPKSGEPEDYILEGQHDPIVADKIGDVWEIHPSTSGEIIREQLKEQFWHNNMYLRISSVTSDIFIPKRGSTVFVTEEGKEFIEEKSDGWLKAEECVMNEKGLYIVHEWDIKKLMEMKNKSHPLNSIPFLQNDTPDSQKD